MIEVFGHHSQSFCLLMAKHQHHESTLPAAVEPPSCETNATAAAAFGNALCMPSCTLIWLQSF